MGVVSLSVLSPHFGHFPLWRKEAGREGGKAEATMTLPFLSFVSLHLPCLLSSTRALPSSNFPFLSYLPPFNLSLGCLCVCVCLTHTHAPTSTRTHMSCLHLKVDLSLRQRVDLGRMGEGREGGRAGDLSSGQGGKG